MTRPTLSDIFAETFAAEQAPLDAQNEARRQAAVAAGQPEPRPRLIVDRNGRPRS